jgi:hypothetical protein
MAIYASYITLDGIQFSVSPNNVTCSTYTSSNTDIRAWMLVDPTPSSPSTGYVGFVARNIRTTAGPSQRAEGVKSNQDFTIFENSEFANCVEIFDNMNSVIRNNVILGQDGGGSSILAKGGLRNAQIYNNIIHNKYSGGAGIYLGGYSCDACHFDTTTNIEAYNAVAYNNVILNESGGTLYGVIFAGAVNSAFNNNVVIGGSIDMMLGGHNTGPQAPTQNPTLLNNIFSCNGGSATAAISYTGTFTVDYNNFYNCSGAPSQAHAVIGNPMFVNAASDWHLQSGSPAINSGTVVSMPAYGGGYIDVSHDFNGVVRSSPWDLGIYSY